MAFWPASVSWRAATLAGRHRVELDRQVWRQEARQEPAGSVQAPQSAGWSRDSFPSASGSCRAFASATTRWRFAPTRTPPAGVGFRSSSRAFGARSRAPSKPSALPNRRCDPSAERPLKIAMPKSRRAPVADALAENLRLRGRVQENGAEANGKVPCRPPSETLGIRFQIG